MKITLFPAVLLASAAVSLAQPIFPANDTGETRSRSYHVLHYTIDVSIDDQKKQVAGSVTARLVPFLPALDSLVFDAEEMRIRRVWMAPDLDLPFDIRPTTLVVRLPHPYSYRDTLAVTISYTCTPRKGLYFTQPDSTHPGIPWQIWTQGEDMDSHFWFPCYDFPNDFSTSEVIATVPSRYTLLSNGTRIGVRRNLHDGTTTYHWKERLPHASYLTMIAAGTYTVLKDRAGSLPLEYYVYPNDTADARACFARTADMVRFFSREIGYPYPWEKYAQVLIAEFTEGGMENVSATSLMDDITVFNARTRVDESSTSLIAHELAHQWWGDVVTCKDWRHLWLNEGFASYFDPLYHEHWLGEDEFHYIMYQEQQKGILSDLHHGRKPIVSIGSYVSNIYSRGAAVLHMLRSVLGDSLFRRSMHLYITKHQFSPVETNDFKNAIEEATGQNLSWFFNEWVYKSGYPIFALADTWDDTAKCVHLTVRQTQSQDSLTGIFRMPVEVEVCSASRRARYRVNILSGDTTFIVPSPDKPSCVLFDPDDWMLKEETWVRSPEEWEYQAGNAENPVERIRALQHLSSQTGSPPPLALFSGAALHDPFWAVREQGVRSLEAIASDSESFKDSVEDVMLAAARDARPSVRSAAVGALAIDGGSRVIVALRAALQDSSDRVVATALRSLSKVDTAIALPLAVAYLDTPSYHDIVANTALSILSRLDSSLAIAAAFRRARYAGSAYARYTALEILLKHRKGDPVVTGMFVQLLTDRNQYMRSYAARALGEIGDPSVLPALERMAGDTGDEASGAAQQSVEMLKERPAQ